MDAAIYCRSSKDRAELGLDIQRNELLRFAESKGMSVVAEYSDMEISGSLDETSRPGLRDLLKELRNPGRRWRTILAVDMSRIARDPLLQMNIEVEAERQGVNFQYSQMVLDNSPASEMMKGVMRSVHHFHAQTSAQKGRSGLEANIAKGFRAGGAAPLGYTLKHQDTGGTRAGVAVSKSSLVIDPPNARRVGLFLKARSAGCKRKQAADASGLGDKAIASLIGIERNALTYAGHTVWNMRKKHKPTREDSRKTMELRPRDEWIISEEPTHEAVIDRAEAERILALNERVLTKRPRVCKPDEFMLSGLLFTPSGIQWHGDAHDTAYRAGAKGRRINAKWVEAEVVMRLSKDFVDPKFLARTVTEAKRMSDEIQLDTVAIDVDIKKAQRQLDNLLNLAAESGERSLLAKIHAIEEKINQLREQKATWAERALLKRQLGEIDEKSIRHLLSLNGLDLREPQAITLIGEEEDRLSQEQLRRILTTLVERVTLDPDTREFTISYRLPVPVSTGTGVKLASPRGFAQFPALRLIRSFQAPGRKAA